MTPGARVAAAIAVLDDWVGGMPAEQALTRWARSARYAGSKDRAAVRDHVYDALRRLRSAEVMGGGPGGRAVMLGLLRLGLDDPAAVFTGDGHAPPPLSDHERQVLSEPSVFPGPETDIPDWLRDAVSERAQHPGEISELFRALSQRAPVWLRVARRRGTVDAARADLAREGIDTEASDLLDGALRISDGARRLKQSQAYTNGLVELQDLSAQRAVAFIDWPAEGRILDYCAGGGGKALAIADRTGAEVLAHDAVPRRMADLPARAVRAGVRIAQVDWHDLTRHAPFDAVLCDVPCSGTGTWRRDPEAKWRLTPERLNDLRRVQAEILEAAAPLVRPGGRLIYMTCSLLRVENEDQVARFIDGTSGWTRLGLQVDTPLTASDGFFTAELRRDG
jgi:16S rRNA (cytosine967-C5)-methyltransferase